MEHISGGVCAAKGFQAGGIHCGIRKNRGKRDISMIISEVPASAAAVYTSNLVKGAPIYVTQRNLAGGIAQLAVCNSGNANTCNADGEDVAWQMCELAGKAAGKPVGSLAASMPLRAALSRVALRACGSMSMPQAIAAPSLSAAIARMPEPQP